MKRIGSVLLVALVALAACGGEEEGKRGPGQACESDADCASGRCVVAADGSKSCAQSADDDGGGW